jgi:hypothetical protein
VQQHDGRTHPCALICDREAVDVDSFHERLPDVVEVRGMNHVPGSAQLVGEREAACRQALRVMEKQELSHERHTGRAPA